VCCGKSHTLLLTQGGIVWSWGANRRGQLGHGTFQSSSVPRCVSEIIKLTSKLVRVSVIDCGDYHSVCIAEPGGK
jgi:alpha-tubulin suppressor-like RCC1 family protein